MYRIQYLFPCLSLLLISSISFAASLALTNIDEDALQKLTGDFSANFAHTTVSGASTLGNVFSFEVGLIGGMTNTPHIHDLVLQADPNSDVKRLPDLALVGLFSIPLGFTAEVGLVPKVGSSDFKFNTFSLAGKWTPTEGFLDWPFSAAVRASFTRSAAEFNNTANNVAATYKFTDTQTALTLLASKNLGLVEPYFGVGMVSATGDLSASGNLVFNPAYNSSGQAKVSRSGTQWLLGGELKLLVCKMGLEYSNLFATSRYVAKLSFFF